MSRAIDVRLKLDSFLGQFAEGVQTEDLKASAVGEDRTLPGNESMQTAELIDRQVSGSQIKMIGVAEDYRCSSLLEHLLCQCLDRALRANRHEGGCVERPVGCHNSTTARLCFFIARDSLE